MQSSGAPTPEYGDFAEPIIADGREIVELVATGIEIPTRVVPLSSSPKPGTRRSKAAAASL